VARLPAIAVLAGAVLTAALLLAQRSAERPPAPPSNPAQSATQPSTPQQSSTDQNTAVLQGQVVNALTGEPLRKAQVTLRPVVLGGPGGITRAGVGDDGGFALTSVGPGQYQLSADRVGFVNQGYGAPPASFKGTPIDVAAGQSIGNLVIRMLPQGVIQGRVLDDDGDPVERAEVQLWRFDYPDGDRQLVRQPVGTPGTNDLGEYRFSGLPPGSYIVSATAPLSNSGAGKQPETDSIATYYPRGVDAKSAAPVEVTPGSDARGIDIRILKSRLFEIRGVVIGAPSIAPAAQPPVAGGGRGGRGGARPSVTVFLSSVDSAALPRSGTVNPDGSFVVQQVGPGSYTLQASTAANGQQQRQVARASVEVSGRDVEGLTLRMLPLVTVSGGVTMDPRDAPAPSFSGLHLLLRSLARLGQTTAQVGDNGSFQTQAQLFGDTYRLEASGLPDGYYLKAVKLAGQEVPDAILDLSSGAPAQIELVVAATSGVLAGSVNNSKGAPAIGVKITVVPASDATRRDLYLSQTTDTSGNFAFKSLPPGKYRLYAWDQIEGNSWMSREFRMPFESSAGTAELADNGTTNITLNLIEGVH
jgi:hypothetical protein